jgi:hypothetical protein
MKKIALLILLADIFVIVFADVRLPAIIDSEFYIAGEDKSLYLLLQIEGNTVVGWSNSVKSPIVVRFGFTY